MQPNDQQPTEETNASNNEAVNTPQPTEPTGQEADSPTSVTETTTPEAQPAPAAPSIVTSAVAPPPMSSTDTNQAVTGPKKRFSFLKTKKAKLIALIIAVIIVLAGASAGAYFGIIAPAQPQRIVGDSLSNTLNSEKIKSAKFEGEITCVDGDACKSLSAVVFKGGANENGSFDLNLQAKTSVTTVSLDARFIEKALYLRLSGLNGLDKLLGSEDAGLGTSQYAKMLTQINNNWYTIDESLIKQFGGSISVPTDQTRLSKEDAQKIGEAYKKHQFIKVDKKLGDEKIHGQSSYHLQARIDKAELKAFATEVKNANIKDFNLVQSDIDKLDKADFGKYPFEMWVNKSNRMISQLAITIKEQGSTAKIRLAIYDYNQTVNVEKPSGAKSVLELVSGLYSSSSLNTNDVQGAQTSNPLSLLGL